MVNRWRLEPKDEDIEKYKSGELVEPKKPIVFYIDPATPKKWIPYLIQGVNDWQIAFEKAGFKNAIMGKVAPARRSVRGAWMMQDIRRLFTSLLKLPMQVDPIYMTHEAGRFWKAILTGIIM